MRRPMHFSYVLPSSCSRVAGLDLVCAAPLQLGIGWRVSATCSAHMLFTFLLLAAVAKMLTAKVDGPNGIVAKIGGRKLNPFIAPLFAGLFSITENAKLNVHHAIVERRKGHSDGGVYMAAGP